MGTILGIDCIQADSSYYNHRGNDNPLDATGSIRLQATSWFFGKHGFLVPGYRCEGALFGLI